MYELNIITDFSAAHSLRNYKGKCEALHGHNWKIEVYVQAKELDSIGLALDFKVLKRETDRLLDGLDHVCLNEISPFNEINPSSENIARVLFEQLSNVINKEGVKVSKVRVWESDRAAAAYY
ncbi:MAG: 6-carboxytetrahydropterin synthase QueD [Thermodesulfobacteriota bacterium]